MVDGDLKEKKHHAWQRGMDLGNADKKPSEEEVEKEGWVRILLSWNSWIDRGWVEVYLLSSMHS